MSRRKADRQDEALVGLTDDPGGRVAEAVWSHVFAHVWNKRPDLTEERRRLAAATEASAASAAAREEYCSLLKAQIAVRPTSPLPAVAEET